MPRRAGSHAPPHLPPLRSAGPGAVLTGGLSPVPRSATAGGGARAARPIRGAHDPPRRSWSRRPRGRRHCRRGVGGVAAEMVSPAASAGRLGSALPFLLVLFDLQYQGEGRRGVSAPPGAAQGELRPAEDWGGRAAVFPPRPTRVWGKRGCRWARGGELVAHRPPSFRALVVPVRPVGVSARVVVQLVEPGPRCRGSVERSQCGRVLAAGSLRARAGGGSAGRPGGGSISGKGMRKKEVQNCHLIAAVVRSV